MRVWIMRTVFVFLNKNISFTLIIGMLQLISLESHSSAQNKCEYKTQRIRKKMFMDELKKMHREQKFQTMKPMFPGETF